MKRIALAFVFALLIGCGVAPPPTLPPIEPTIAEQILLASDSTEVRLLGARATEYQRLFREFQRAPEGVQHCPYPIRIYRIQGKHFGEIDCAHFDPKDKDVDAGRVEPSISICALYPRVRRGTLRHELTHAYMYRTVPSLDGWRKIPGARYLRYIELLGDIKDFPQRGFLRPYSEYSELEDIACFVEGVDCFCTHEPDPWTLKPNPFFGITSDEVPRYRARLLECKRMKLVTELEYKTVNEYFDSREKK